jgi:hypothetical protein
MKMLIAAVTFGSLIAAPTFAQSHDPDLGKRKLAWQSDAPANARAVDREAFARVAPSRSRSRSARAAYGAVTPFGSPTASQTGQNTADTVREAALRECSVKSRQWLETTWGDMQMHQFRTCMMQHGQPE